VNGVPESFKLRSLGLIRARDMPDVTVILVESNDPEGPFGAKGVGEIGLVPTRGPLPTRSTGSTACVGTRCQ